jgi:hypothetical protein
MPYTTEEGGRLNNFAREPKVYQAEPLSGEQKRNNIIVASVGAVLVGGLMVVAYAISHSG